MITEGFDKTHRCFKCPPTLLKYFIQLFGNSFFKGPDSESFRVAGQMVSVATAQLCLLQQENSHRQYVNERPRLRSNGTLSTKTGNRPNLACGWWFADHCFRQ